MLRMEDETLLLLLLQQVLHGLGIVLRLRSSTRLGRGLATVRRLERRKRQVDFESLHLGPRVSISGLTWDFELAFPGDAAFRFLVGLGYGGEGDGELAWGRRLGRRRGRGRGRRFGVERQITADEFQSKTRISSRV